MQSKELGRWGLVPNLLILGFLVAAAWLARAFPEVYYQSVQEDRALEWASFLSFFLASAVFLVAAVRQRRQDGVLPWFMGGVALFCLFVAMEEISWGQRVFGHSPPDYFLAENFQQELNLHNIASTDLRLLAFRGVVLGYGVLLPLLGLLPAVRRVYSRLSIVPPPVVLAPSMLAIAAVHWEYPWKFTGEVVECALGFGFLFAGIAASVRFSSRPVAGMAARVAGVTAGVVALAFGTAWWSQNSRASDPAQLELADAETEALRDDIVAITESTGRAPTKCGLHKRLYTLVQERERARPLKRGAFADLVNRGLSEKRAEFFLDPWGSPYWVRDRCERSSNRHVIFVYSFGPNRSRDSDRWEILGDDIGHYAKRAP